MIQKLQLASTNKIDLLFSYFNILIFIFTKVRQKKSRNSVTRVDKSNTNVAIRDTQRAIKVRYLSALLLMQEVPWANAKNLWFRFSRQNELRDILRGVQMYFSYTPRL